MLRRLASPSWRGAGSAGPERKAGSALPL